MAADRDGSGKDADAGTTTTAETHTGAPDGDAYPDTENHALGNSPAIAYRDQGLSGGPNGWDNYIDDDESGLPDDPGDLWGSTYPDAAAEDDADLDDGSSSPDGQDHLHQHDPAAGSNAPPDQAAPAETSAEQNPAQATERIRALETEYAETQHQLDETTQKVADLGVRNAGLEAKDVENREKIGKLEAERADDRQEIADLKAQNADLAARMDRFEQLMAGTGKSQDGTAATPDQGAEKPDTMQSPDPRDQSLAERQDTDQGSDTAVAEDTRWRRAVTSENAGIAGTLMGAGQTVADFAMHATPEGMVTLGATVLGLASVGLAKMEKRRKGKT